MGYLASPPPPAKQLSSRLFTRVVPSLRPRGFATRQTNVMTLYAQQHGRSHTPVRCIEVLMEAVGSRDSSSLRLDCSSALQVAPFALCSLFFIFT